jgi:DNA invertase Pin-like site-specific DNA recombinase
LQELIGLAKTKSCPFKGILIDDTSRFGRYLPDVLRELDILRHYEIFVYFVSPRLDSRDSSFEISVLFHGYTDQQYVTGLSQKVHRGQKGRVLNGYSPGGRCYGYKNVAKEDPTRRGEYGRPAVIGVNQQVAAEEAAVVRRIFEMYAGGASYATIAKTLNAERVLSPQPPRRRKVRGWCPTGIREMLLNERYRGVRVWNRVQYVLNPETGKTEARRREESEHVRFEDETLRIVPDELWHAVRDQNARVREKHGPKRLGGMSRTANSRRYLFSGLLVCGLCGANITIVGGKAPNARYGCPNYRYRGICDNRLTVTQRSLESQLIKALSNNLLAPERIDQHVKAFKARLADELEERSKRAREIAGKRYELKQESQDLSKKAENLVNAIAQYGLSSLLSAELASVEARMADINRAQDAASAPEVPSFSDDEIRIFLQQKGAALADFLLADPITAKNELQKHISQLVLTPKETPGGPTFEVTGDIALFVGKNEGVLQYKSPEGIVQQYRIPLSLSLRKQVRWHFPPKGLRALQNRERFPHPAAWLVMTPAIVPAIKPLPFGLNFAI